MTSKLLLGFNWIKGHILAIGAVLISVLVAVISNLRRQKAKVKAGLAQGEANQLKRSNNALHEAHNESDKLVKAAKDRADNNIRRDIK